jgi:hypothetical protein
VVVRVTLFARECFSFWPSAQRPESAVVGWARPLSASPHFYCKVWDRLLFLFLTRSGVNDSTGIATTTTTTTTYSVGMAAR